MNGDDDPTSYDPDTTATLPPQAELSPDATVTLAPQAEPQQYSPPPREFAYGRSRLEAAYRALVVYGAHQAGCARNRRGVAQSVFAGILRPELCTCGFDDVLTRLEINLFDARQLRIYDVLDETAQVTIAGLDLED